MHFVKITFFAMILYKIPITQAILIFSIPDRRIDGDLIVLLGLYKYY
jgi:hypothetical protein